MHAPNKYRRLFVIGVPLAATLKLAGCGSDDGSSEEVGTAPTPSPAPSPGPTPAPSPGGVPPLAAPRDLPNDQQIGTNTWPDGSTATGGQRQEVAGLTCGDVPRGFHNHCHLSIIRDGQVLAIPAFIGISPAANGMLECHYNVHTHDHGGILHLHGSVPTVYTLGQFFAIWGMPLARDNVAGITGLPVVAYLVDQNDPSTAREFTGDLSSIELVSRREICLQIGAPIAEVPNYVLRVD
jgi:hypothetical protein